MKKVLMAATLVIAIAGIAAAQTKPAPAQKKPKKETTAPAPAKETPAKDTTAHAKKHHAKKQ